jgi:hypothetical protein
VRVYLPATLPALAETLASGGIGQVPVPGYAVTPALREWYAGGDEEELEYAAMRHAAQASLRLLAADSAAPRRRVVLAAEVPDAGVRIMPDLDEPGLVEVVTQVAVRDIRSGHVDDRAAEAVIAAAADALPAADSGDSDAQFVVDGAEDLELLWYATQELHDLASL